MFLVKTAAYRPTVSGVSTWTKNGKDERTFRVVGTTDHVRFVGEGVDHDNRTKDFLLVDDRVVGDVSKDRGVDKVALRKP